MNWNVPVVLAGVLAGLSALPAVAGDAESCKAVRIADAGWTDIALTNATAEVLLSALGYAPEQSLLSLDVSYISLKEGDMDVFQGNWRPFQDEQYKAYFDDGSVEVLGQNLEGAKYTIAVPKYVADAGVKDFNDLAAHAAEFDKKIYGIEPGSNQPLLDMVAVDRHGLGGWEIVESSEVAMLTEVERKIGRKEWIAFLGWQPHPMNVKYEMTYLSGGDIEFGPNFGGATVRTISRKGFAAECPNAAKVFSNLVFDIGFENEGMLLITEDGKSPVEAARAMIAKEPERLDAWLNGVTTLDGQPGLPAVRAALGL
jgi:glycine betaine/proline transport system substrate-binding protein